MAAQPEFSDDVPIEEFAVALAAYIGKPGKADKYTTVLRDQEDLDTVGELRAVLDELDCMTTLPVIASKGVRALLGAESTSPVRKHSDVLEKLLNVSTGVARLTAGTAGADAGSESFGSRFAQLTRAQSQKDVGLNAVLPIGRSPHAVKFMPQKFKPVGDKMAMDGFLIDLDGTMYRPDGLIDGAKEFYEWLLANDKKFVFLSNTGCKGSEATQHKFLSDTYHLSDDPVPLDHIRTAAEAVADYMADNAPPDAKVFIVHGKYENTSVVDLLKAAAPEKMETWEWRTDLTEAQCKEWADLSETTPGAVWVVFSNDGPIDSHVDPVTNQPGYGDWMFDVIKRTAWLVTFGAKFVYSADDAFNPSSDPLYPDRLFPLPGPGPFAALIKTMVYPHNTDNFVCCGKGGNLGAKYMMQVGIDMLKAQGHSGDLSTICMIGDRFDTDIRGGNSVGINTVLVESGAHVRGEAPYYPDAPTFYFHRVYDVIHAME